MKEPCTCRDEKCVGYQRGYRDGLKAGTLKARAEVRVEKDHQYQLTTPQQLKKTRKR